MTSATEAALREALEDEYKARATYRAVIEAFGPLRPFTSIVGSEERHIAALLRQFARLGWTPPADDWPGRVTVPESVEAACRVGIAAEIENEALYDRLIAQAGDAQVIALFRRLQAASRDRHLPAFRRCAEGGRGKGRGSGQGSNGGRGAGAGGRRWRGGRGGDG